MKEKKIAEDFLEFIWFSKLFLKNSLFLETVDGKKIEILSVGTRNLYSGPDISGIKICVDGTVFSGNAEIHVKTSDWAAHKHQKNKDFNSVLLHIVYEHNKKLDLSPLFTIELKGKIPENVYEQYTSLMEARSVIPCEKQIKNISRERVRIFQEQLFLERCLSKLETIKKELTRTNNNWEETAYRICCKYFGTNINALPFYELAVSLPKKRIDLSSNDPLKLEALVFGQSGLLNESFEEEYPNLLKKEYEYCKKSVFTFSHKRNPLEKRTNETVQPSMDKNCFSCFISFKNKKSFFRNTLDRFVQRSS